MNTKNLISFYDLQDNNNIIKMDFNFNNIDNNFLFGLDYDILLMNNIENIETENKISITQNQKTNLYDIPMIPMPKESNICKISKSKNRVKSVKSKSKMNLRKIYMKI